MQFKTHFLLAVVVSLFFSVSLFADNFSVEDYGLLPNIKSVSISPDGQHYAFIKQTEEGNLFAIVNIADNKMIGGANAGELKARSVYFATNNHVILSTSKKMSSMRIRGNWEQSGAVVYNLKTKKMTALAKRVKDLFIAQGGLGRIVGINAEENQVYMPAYIGSRDPSNSLFRINLDNLSARRHSRGNSNVRDWFVNKNGQVIAREEFSEREQDHSVLSYTSDKWETVYRLKTDIPEIAVVAVSQYGEKVIFESNIDNYDAVYSMSLQDGAISEPMFQEDETDIDGVLTNRINREFIGVLYSGLLPNYQYIDDATHINLVKLQNTFPDSAVHPVSMTSDKNKMIVLISGNDAADNYVLFDVKLNSLSVIGSGYPEIDTSKIAKVKAIKYKARDGLSITAILTSPVNNTEVKNLPLIVMPHGGPESYTSIDFNWWSQFLARKGYLVLQPNFRGSSGFGQKFTEAGHGKWGAEMQDDVSDGVTAMVKAGYADPERVCIMGASYGGYSALAGGAFTPELYRCVISVAGVSDLPLMLKNEKYTSGRNSWVFNYWNTVIGDSKNEKNKLKTISPINSVDKFQAPLLLLHGKDDTVVPIVQSTRMYKAMKRANKDVDFITLKGEDHWLSSSDTRLAMLKEISEFLDEHNPVD